MGLAEIAQTPAVCRSFGLQSSVEVSELVPQVEIGHENKGTCKNNHHSSLTNPYIHIHDMQVRLCPDHAEQR